MEEKYTTRQAMAYEVGLNVKAFMKKLEEFNITLKPRERISPALQHEIRMHILGADYQNKRRGNGGAK
jgi:hypothetical protein